MREQAFLNAGIRVVLTDKRTDETIATIGKSDDLCFEGGIKSYVEYLLAGIKKESLINDVIYLSGSKGDEMAEIALLWSTAYDNRILSFANTLHTIDGGTHEQAFRQTVTRVVNKYAHDFKKLKESSDNLKADDIMEGLVAVVSVKLADAQFESQTKAKLGNTSIGQLVRDIVNDQLYKYLEENPADSKIVIDKAIAASNAREAAQKAREASRNKAGIGSKTRMPEKLTDCISNDPTKTEIYIVEGDSAAGAIRTSRDAEFQGVMPVRGKILNCLKADYPRIFKSDVITDLMKVLGCGVEIKDKRIKNLGAFDLDNLNWNKVIICTDADVDGYHIRTLVLTMLYRLVPTLIDEGYVYIAESPLYEINCKEKTYFAYTELEKNGILKEIGDQKCSINRSKGLGENDPDMMWLTTMNPETRRLIRVMPEDVERTAEVFDLLLGDNLQGRKDHIAENGARFLDLADIS